MLYARMLDRTVIVHPEDPDLGKRGVMHSGVVSLSLGLPGKSSASEEVMVARDIAIARITKARLHFAQVSTRGALQLVRAAKAEGLPVSCAVSPHHLTPADDVEALVEAIASHSREKKEVEFQVAPSGVIGLETTLPVVLTELVHTRGLPVARLIELLSVGPAKILGIPGGTLASGSPGDVTVFALDEAHTIRDDFRSNSHNSPFIGWQVKGRAHCTVVDGRIVYERASAEDPS